MRRGGEWNEIARVRGEEQGKYLLCLSYVFSPSLHYFHLFSKLYLFFFFVSSSYSSSSFLLSLPLSTPNALLSSSLFLTFFPSQTLSLSSSFSPLLLSPTSYLFPFRLPHFPFTRCFFSLPSFFFSPCSYSSSFL